MSFRDGPKDQTRNLEIPGLRLSTRPGMTRHRIFFTIFVDAIFTTLFERLITNVFDVIAARSANHCVCRACHAD
jgi:hypothetical protein